MTGSDTCLLTIAIPTYNRAGKLDDCLGRIVTQLEATRPPVRVVVYNNASTDATAAVVEKWTKRCPAVTAHANPVNLGFVGNYCRCIRECRTEYVWVVGDDDPLRPGAIDAVLAAIEASPRTGFFLLNYGSIDMKTGNRRSEAVFPTEGPESSADARGFFEECMAREYGCAMFITACVYQAKSAAAALAEWPAQPDNVALPLHLSGATAARQGMRLVRRVCFDGTYAENSWSGISFKVQMTDMPEIYARLLRQDGFSPALGAGYHAEAASYFRRPRGRMLKAPLTWWRAFRAYGAFRRAVVAAKKAG